MANKEFKPVFKGYMKVHLHDDDPDRLADRAVFTGDWLPKKRGNIIKRTRKYKVTLHLLDTDGDKRGLQGMVFTEKGGKSDISKTIVNFGNEFADELRADDPLIIVDFSKSYAVVRA